MVEGSHQSAKGGVVYFGSRSADACDGSDADRWVALHHVNAESRWSLVSGAPLEALERSRIWRPRCLPLKPGFAMENGGDLSAGWTTPDPFG